MEVAYRSKRSMLYATFYARYQDVEEMKTTPGPILQNNPFNLDNIGDGYEVWSRSGSQLLLLAVILVILTLIFAAIVALDCGRHGPLFMRSGTLRDIIWHGRGRTSPRTNGNGRSGDNASGDLKG
uniref:Movement protein n=1 Tax=Caenorhabditis tropicalis TaxID=1561998 RepID=A0A1I7TYR7_9PELO